MPNNGLEPIKRANRELKEFRGLSSKGWIAGVCAGLSYRLGVAPWMVRLTLTMLFLFHGVGLGLYVGLWIFVPKTDKLPADYVPRTCDSGE